jgi:zinc and cadmium transporter
MTEATYGVVIFFSLIGGVFSLIGGIVLLSRKAAAYTLAKYLTPFAAGALLAAVFLDLLPEGIHSGAADSVLLAALIGMLIFFFMERFLLWFHHHHQHEGDKKPGASLIIAGDTLHNALDGVAIAAAFLVSVPTGIVTTIAVAAHEIPQEIGDFGLLLNKGMARSRVLLANILSALSTTVAAVVAFALGSAGDIPVGVLLGLTAGFLLYIAASDIIPEIHERAAKKRLIDVQPLLLLVGVVVVGMAINLAHAHIETGEHGHSHSETSQHEDEGDHHDEDEHQDGHADEDEKHEDHEDH